jgi:hypothetical protein
MKATLGINIGTYILYTGVLLSTSTWPTTKWTMLFIHGIKNLEKYIWELKSLVLVDWLHGKQPDQLRIHTDATAVI